MNFFTKLVHNFKLSGFRSKRADFYRELARSIEAKESMKVFLEEEHKIAVAKKTANSARAYAFKVMLAKRARADDNSLSSLLVAVMPPSDKLMLSAIDDAPDKPLLLRTLASAIDAQRQLIGLVKRKVLMPLAILPGVIGFAYMVATRQVPTISEVAPPEVWDPPLNWALKVFCEFLVSYGLIAAIVFLVAVRIFFWQLPRWVGLWRMRLESMNPWLATLLFPFCPILLPLTIYRDLQVGLLFTSLAVMLQSGRTLKDSLVTIRAASQPWMRWHIQRILSYLETHTTAYKEAFSRGLISPSLLARLSSQIRNSPGFSEVLINVGTAGDSETRVEVEKRASVLNGMLFGFSGVLFAFLYVSQQLVSSTAQDLMQPTEIKKRRARAAAQAELILPKTPSTGIEARPLLARADVAPQRQQGRV